MFLIYSLATRQIIDFCCHPTLPLRQRQMRIKLSHHEIKLVMIKQISYDERPNVRCLKKIPEKRGFRAKSPPILLVITPSQPSRSSQQMATSHQADLHKNSQTKSTPEAPSSASDRALRSAAPQGESLVIDTTHESSHHWQTLPLPT